MISISSTLDAYREAEQQIVRRLGGRGWLSAAQILGPDGPERVALRDALLRLVERGEVAESRRGWGTHEWTEYALSVWRPR